MGNDKTRRVGINGIFEKGVKMAILPSGIEIIIDANMVDTEIVRRTWRERFLSIPWHPLRAYKTITKPKKDIWKIGNKLVCHPVMWNEIKKQLEGE